MRTLTDDTVVTTTDTALQLSRLMLAVQTAVKVSFQLSRLIMLAVQTIVKVNFLLSWLIFAHCCLVNFSTCQSAWLTTLSNYISRLFRTSKCRKNTLNLLSWSNSTARPNFIARSAILIFLPVIVCQGEQCWPPPARALPPDQQGLARHPRQVADLEVHHQQQYPGNRRDVRLDMKLMAVEASSVLYTRGIVLIVQIQKIWIIFWTINPWPIYCNNRVNR